MGPLSTRWPASIGIGRRLRPESLGAAQAKGNADTKGACKTYVGQMLGDKIYFWLKPDAINRSDVFELYSDTLKKNLAPLPTFTAVTEHAYLKPCELILTTYKVNVQIHSRSANCKWLSEIFHGNSALINFVTVEKPGIKEPAKVVAASTIGTIEVEVWITLSVVPGVLGISHHCGHWEYGLYASGKR
jgi:anaerobic selenocysteine-containing dehydrogenase